MYLFICTQLASLSYRVCVRACIGRTGILEASVTCICGVPGDTASWQRLAGTS